MRVLQQRPVVVNRAVDGVGAGAAPALADDLNRPGRVGSCPADPSDPMTPEDLGPERIFVGLGANLGDRLAALQQARRALDRWPGSTVLGCSSLYRSAPVQASGPEFLNAVLELRSSLSPLALLAALQTIESRQGRERPYPNAPRTLDLDLLLFGQRVCGAPRLCLPHPRLHLRAFVLAPLLELAPDLNVPELGPLSPWLLRAAGQEVARADTDWAAPCASQAR